MKETKLRVWHIPQVGYDFTFYVPVESPEEGFKMMQVLGAYDMFQFQNNIKPDYCNTCGLEYYDEEDKEWYDWYSELGESIREYAERNNIASDVFWKMNTL